MNKVFWGRLGAAVCIGVLGYALGQMQGGRIEKPVEFTSLPAPASVSGVAADKIMSTLKTLQSDVKVTTITESQFTGLYAVTLASGRTLYATKDGTYVFAGNLFQNVAGKGIVNVTEEGVQKVAMQRMATLKTSDMVIYPAAERKASITVFTDVDCPYCAKLHEDLPKLTAKGVEVRYLAFPRMGLESETYKKMVNVWCARDRQQAMDKAKGAAENLERASCNNPVAEQFQLGQDLGVRGTPTIYLQNGEMIGGYSPPDRLAEMALAATKK